MRYGGELKILPSCLAETTSLSSSSLSSSPSLGNASLVVGLAGSLAGSTGLGTTGAASVVVTAGMSVVDAAFFELPNGSRLKRAPITPGFSAGVAATGVAAGGTLVPGAGAVIDIVPVDRSRCLSTLLSLLPRFESVFRALRLVLSNVFAGQVGSVSLVITSISFCRLMTRSARPRTCVRPSTDRSRFSTAFLRPVSIFSKVFALFSTSSFA